MARNIVGPPVRGGDCFGREDFINELGRQLKTESVLLVAPRRWGKTSVLQALRDVDPGKRHYLDLYHLTSASAFAAEVAATTAGFLAGVRSKVESLLAQTLGRVEEIRIAEVAVALRDRLAQEESWESAAASILGSIPQDHLLILDEFPVMAKAILDQDPAHARVLLRLLRHERQRDGSPRFVFAGSTSLTDLCRQHGLSDTINDLGLVPLPRFDRTTAAALLAEIFQTEKTDIAPAAIDSALDLVGPEVPYFLQILSRAILSEVRNGAARVTPALVRRVYRESLLSAEYRSYLDDFHGRLDRAYLPAEREVAITLLNTLSRHRDGLDLRALRNAVIAADQDGDSIERVLSLMQGDFYVSGEHGTRYRFVNRYLADWWERFHA